MPKLIDSEITRIDSKAKEIGTAYSLFLMKQKKFQVLSHEANYYEAILSVMMAIVIDKCFSKEECDHLAKCTSILSKRSIGSSELTPLIQKIAGRTTFQNQPKYLSANPNKSKSKPTFEAFVAKSVQKLLKSALMSIISLATVRCSAVLQ